MNLRLLISTFVLSALVFMPRAYAQDSGRTIPIVAKRFTYSPGEVRLKKGETVTLVLTTADTTHGLQSKELGLDTLIPPGKETRVTLTPSATGRFTAVCSKFCGPGHAGMAMDFVVE